MTGDRSMRVRTCAFQLTGAMLPPWSRASSRISRWMVSELVVALGERSYSIHLTKDLPGARVVEAMRGLREAPAPVLIVTDDNVGPLYAEDLVGGLQAAGYGPSVITLTHGEGSKSLTTLSRVLDAGLAAGLSRRDVIIALGGGVMEPRWLRGLSAPPRCPYVQVQRRS